MVYRFFDKKSTGSGVTTSLANKSAIVLNFQLANELQIIRQIIWKLKRRKVYSLFKTIFGVLI